MKITFRADASVQIGTGHVMRCLTLAAKGVKCQFICRAQLMFAVIRQRDAS